MTLYLDASVTVAALITDALSHRAHKVLGQTSGVLLSHWTLAESSSALNRIQRIGGLDAAGRSQVEKYLENWAAQGVVVPLRPADIPAARALLLRTSTALRAGDALHLAIALRLRVALATFDVVLAEAAAEAGLEVVAG